MTQGIKPEMMSRRKALSLLGLGAAFGFTLSSALEPLEAEAQEATTPPPPPLRPPEHTGCNGGQGDAPLAIIDGTPAAPVNLPPPSNSSANAIAVRPTAPGADCAVRRTSAGGAGVCHQTEGGRDRSWRPP